jgi:hypothetical protein
MAKKITTEHYAPGPYGGKQHIGTSVSEIKEADPETDWILGIVGLVWVSIHVVAFPF